MVKRLSFIAGLAIMLLAASCDSNKREVNKVAYKYLMATANYDIDAAEQYASQETRERTIPFMRKLMTMTDSAYIQANTPASIVIDTVNVFGDTAYVSYTKTTPIKTLHSDINLVKEDGRWLVYVLLKKEGESLSPQPTVADTIANVD